MTEKDKELVDYLQLPNPDYWVGVALHRKWCDRQRLQATVFSHGPTVKSWDELLYEMKRNIDNPQIIKSPPPKPVEPPQVRKQRIMKKVEAKYEANAIMDKIKSLLKETDFLFQKKLGDDTPKKEREKAALRIKDVRHHIIPNLYKQLEQNPEAPPKQVEVLALKKKLRNAEYNVKRNRDKGNMELVKDWQVKAEKIKKQLFIT